MLWDDYINSIIIPINNTFFGQYILRFIYVALRFFPWNTKCSHDMMQGILKVAISLELFSMGSMIWKWDQGVIDDLSCLFYWRPGVFLLELIGCCCPNLYLPFIHFLQPLQLDKRGNWLFFLAEKKRHIREQSPHFYWLSIIQTKNPIFPSIFARRRFSSELPDFIREFYWGVYGQTRLWVREWYTTSSDT